MRLAGFQPLVQLLHQEMYWDYKVPKSLSQINEESIIADEPKPRPRIGVGMPLPVFPPEPPAVPVKSFTRSLFEDNL